MKKQVAIITGASRGIGAETARTLARDGFLVVINYLKSEKKAVTLAKEIEKTKGQATVVKADMRRVDDINLLINRTLKNFGRIDALIHNACPPITYTSFRSSVWSDFQDQLDVSVKAFYYLMKGIQPVMIKQKYGRIVSIATALALNVPVNKLSHYITAKSALIGMSKSLAVELAPHGITVNTVSPGVTNTDFLNNFPPQMKEIMASKIPIKRLANPKDIAVVVSFLCSKNADYITGINIPVAGGMVM